MKQTKYYIIKMDPRVIVSANARASLRDIDFEGWVAITESAQKQFLHVASINREAVFLYESYIVNVHGLYFVVKLL